LLTNHKPELHIRRRPSESTNLATSLIIHCSSFACHSNAKRKLAEAGIVHYVCALMRRYPYSLMLAARQGIINEN
uniref:Myosin motor domain-containing protein n=1 Tax=Mesocestoides corti TaxID=53468 RepID=A0A5K3EK12_MESCO